MSCIVVRLVGRCRVLGLGPRMSVRAQAHLPWFHKKGDEIVSAAIERSVIVRSLVVRSSFRCSSWCAVTFVLVHICHGSRVCSCSIYKENAPTRLEATFSTARSGRSCEPGSACVRQLVGSRRDGSPAERRRGWTY